MTQTQKKDPMEPKFLVPLSSPDIGEEEKEAVQEVLSTRWLALGPKIKAFEKAIQEFTGAKHAIACSSGTAGLHLCLRAAGIAENDLVLTTPFSFISSSNVMLFEKAIPVFVDVDPKTGNMDTDLAYQAIQDLMRGGAAAQKWLPRKGAENAGPLKGILPVDVFGHPVNSMAWRIIADQFGLFYLEDACEAIGARYLNTQAGTNADMSVFAFYPNKQITTGEGGMIITNDEKKADLMRALCSQGRAPGDSWLAHTYLGYNYRMDEMSAAIGEVQTKRLDSILEERAQVAAWYAEELKDVEGIELPFIEPEVTRVSWFVYVIRVASGLDRNQFIRDLDANGIPARPYFAPIHLQPFMVEQFGYQEGDFPITEDLGNRGVAIPFFTKMTQAQVKTVAEVVKKVIQMQ